VADQNLYPVVSLAQLEEVVIDVALMPTPRPTLALSHPGDGKTETARRIAARIALTVQNYGYFPLELAAACQEEYAGVPAREGNRIVRFPLPAIFNAAAAPGLQHIDEVSRADTSKQGAALTATNERRWGDTFVHPQTCFLMTGNMPESSGTYQLLDALISRSCVTTITVSREEKRAYMRGGHSAPLVAPAPLDVKKFWSERERLLAQYADFSDGRPEMLSEAPPRGFAESGCLWPSGRAVVHAMERVAARSARGLSITDSIALTHVSGCIGRENGVLWLRLNELLGKLPSAAEIEADPDKVKTPPDAESAVSALGMLSTIKPGPLWRWLGRWSENLAEIQAAGVKRNTGKIPPATDSAAVKQYNALAARMNRVLAK
jgi:hypothetical protein